MRHLGGFKKEKRDRTDYEKKQTTHKRSILKKKREEKRLTNFRLGSKDLTKYKNVCGVYKISARYSKTISYKTFVGGSTNVYDRFIHIRTQLRKGTFHNESIQSLYNNNITLILELIEVCDKAILNKRQTSWMSSLKADSASGFNRRGVTQRIKETQYDFDVDESNLKQMVFVFENYDGRIEQLTLDEMSKKNNISKHDILKLTSYERTAIDGWYTLGGNKPLYTLTNTKTNEVTPNLTSFRLSNTKILSRCQISKLLNGKVETAKGYTLTLQDDFINN